MTLREKQIVMTKVKKLLEANNVHYIKITDVLLALKDALK